MPVEALGHGRYRYGRTGKIYTSRAKAERQGRAIEFRRHAGEGTDEAMKWHKSDGAWVTTTNRGTDFTVKRQGKRWALIRNGKQISSHINADTAKAEANYRTSIPRHKRHYHSRAKANPSGTTVLVIGAGVALLGVAAYFLMKKPTTSTTPQVAASSAPQLTAGTLPASANIQAATYAVTLMKIGNQAEVAPAASWLGQFQSSVGLPATGRMDPTTRAYLNLATPTAASLPAQTILG